MDKKNFLIGISLLILAMLMFQQNAERQLDAEKRTQRDANTSKQSELNENSPQDTPLAGEVLSRSEANSSADKNIEADPSQPAPKPREETTFKALDFGGGDPIEIIFTNQGGAIREIRLKKTNRVLKEYKFKYPSEPALAVSFEDRDFRPIKLAGYEESAFERVEDGNSSRLTWTNRAGAIEIRREYWRVPGEDPYLIHHRTTVTNHGNDFLSLDNVRMQIGSARPIDRLYNLFDDSQTYLNIGYYNSGGELDVGCKCANCSGRIDGVEDEFWQINEIGGAGNTYRQQLSKAKWACISNRFFVNIVRPLKEPQGAEVVGRIINLKNPDGLETQGVTGSFSFPFGSVRPGESRLVEIEYYAGPKDYGRLQAIGEKQKTVMQFGIFSWVSEPLNSFLNLLHGWFGNFGLAIIVMTICVKLALWPLTAKSVRSQKMMQELQEPLQALREKHKGNPQKLNQEMMKFYKEHGVNPLAGCWPMLIQIPIFLGLFWMLRSAAELRGAEFLWIEDLSEQDNVAFLGSFSLNVLPIIMTVTQYFQMKLTPMNLGAGATEQQRIQAKMMRMMPYFFLIFLYFFSSALVLYWTIQNCLTIVQTLVTKRTGASPAPTIETTEKNQIKQRSDPSQHLTPEEKQHRKVLGLRLRGKLNKKEIKNAFKQRVAKFHPDKIRNLGSKRQLEAEEKRKKLEQAYEFLLKRE